VEFIVTVRQRAAHIRSSIMRSLGRSLGSATTRLQQLRWPTQHPPSTGNSLTPRSPRGDRPTDRRSHRSATARAGTIHYLTHRRSIGAPEVRRRQCSEQSACVVTVRCPSLEGCNYRRGTDVLWNLLNVESGSNSMQRCAKSRYFRNFFPRGWTQPLSPRPSPQPSLVAIAYTPSPLHNSDYTGLWLHFDDL